MQFVRSILPITVLFVSASQFAFAQSQLPTCPSWPFASWTNCEGEKSYDNGDRYVGAFKDGKRHGQGVLTYSNGNKYIGEFREGNYVGKGTFIQADGDKYVGVFSKGLNGQFTVTYANGDSYVGELKAGKKEGRGALTFANGEKYIGTFKDDKSEGNGALTFTNGERYVGEFRDGKREGKATLYSATKSVISAGVWTEDKYIGTGEADSIKLVQQNGIYVVPIRLNDQISFDAVLDSGSSDVSIPADIVLTLIRTKTVSSEDFLGEQKYRMADGSVVPSRQFRIRSLRVGNRVIENVIATVASVKADILLGQSFLGRLNEVVPVI